MTRKHVNYILSGGPKECQFTGRTIFNTAVLFTSFYWLADLSRGVLVFLNLDLRKILVSARFCGVCAR